MRTSKSIYTIVSVLSCVCFQATSAETCEYFKLDARGEHVFGFPAVIAGLEMLDQGIADDPRIGFFTKYGGDGFFLHVNINSNGNSDIPDGIDSEQILTQYEDLKSRLDQMKAYGRQYELKYERNTSFGSGAIPVLEAQYDLNDGRLDRVSHIFLAAKHGDFIEAKLTYPASKRELSASLIEDVSAALGKVFCELPPFSAANDLAIRTLEPIGTKILVPQDWSHKFRSRDAINEISRPSFTVMKPGALTPGGPISVARHNRKFYTKSGEVLWFRFYPREYESETATNEVSMSLTVHDYSDYDSWVPEGFHEMKQETSGEMFGGKTTCMSADLDDEVLFASLCVIHDSKMRVGFNFIAYDVMNRKTHMRYSFSFSSSEEKWSHYFPIFTSMLNSIEVNPKY